MKIISQKELGHMPNGTVFSEITDPNFYNGFKGDMKIKGLNIICGHNENHDYFSSTSGHFNGCVHMLNYVDTDLICRKDIFYKDDWFTSIDTAEFDYDEDRYFVVYSQEDICAIIRNLLWALRGCKGEQ